MSTGVRLVVAVVLALPTLLAASSMLLTSAVLMEFLSQERWRPLTAMSPEPTVRPLSAAGTGGPVAVDLYTRPDLRRPPGLVLVHGLSPSGKDDPRLQD